MIFDMAMLAVEGSDLVLNLSGAALGGGVRVPLAAEVRSALRAR
jgi:hypothetical protein